MPHSGTRTLVKYLGVATPQEQGLIGDGMWWHFGLQRNIHAILRQDFDAHIPIRHPLDVAGGWASRGKIIESMLENYATMFWFLEEGKEHRGVTLYRMEDIPKLAGNNEHKDISLDLHTIPIYQDAVREKVIEPHRGFFEEFYEDLDRGYKYIR